MLLGKDWMGRMTATTKVHPLGTTRQNAAVYRQFLDATYPMQKVGMIWIFLDGWKPQDIS